MTTPIVGYRYGEPEDLACPQCIYQLFADVDVTVQSDRSTEELLDRRAARLGIRRSDEESYRAREFPKPISAEAVRATDTCRYCWERLLDDQAP